MNPRKGPTTHPTITRAGIDRVALDRLCRGFLIARTVDPQLARSFLVSFLKEIERPGGLREEEFGPSRPSPHPDER